MPPSEPLLTFTSSLEHPFRVQETLSVFADGSIWCWSLMAQGTERSDRAGTYAWSLPADDLAAAHDLAAALVALPPQAATQQRGTPSLTVTAVAAGQQATHLLSVEPPQLLAPLDEAATRMGTWLTQTTQAPLAVVRISAKVQPAPGRDDAINLLFIFEGEGRQEVVFLLAPETFTLYVPNGSGSQQWWQSAPGQASGLIEPLGTLVDGIYTPARLAPGARATAAFLNIPRPPDDSSSQRFMRVEGQIALLRPTEPASDIPHDQFELTAK